MPSRSNKRNSEPTATAAMLKNAADIFSEALFLIDRSRRIILANNAAQQMTTLEETNLIGQQIESILSLENPQTQLKVTSIKLPPKELLVLRAKIHAVPHSATFLPLNYIPYFAAFKPRPIALAIVTPQISTQAQDHTTATIYQQILGQLTMKIAHDFSNSLTSIIGNAELIEEQISALLKPPILEPLTPLLDQGLPEIQDVVRKSREMAQFINTLQQYARQQPTSSRTLDLNTAITETITMARSLLGRKIQIEFLPSEDLSQIYMDRLRIDQILLSILVNSKNAMPAGGRVTIGTEEVFLDAEFVAAHPGAREGSYTRLSITDSSAGMDSATLKRIFDIPNSNKTSDLASLGLPTVYSILKQFRGYIDVESWIGKGTRFDIYFPQTPPGPITPPSAEDDDEVLVLHLLRQPSQIALSPGARLPNLPNGSLILVAEDEADVQIFIQRVVTRAGYETLITGDGTAALELYRKLTKQGNQPALLISDLGLPGTDGRTLCNAIRNEHPTARVLLTSGYRIELDGNSRKTKDGFDFLHKPFAPNILLATIERILSKPST
jgi:signal transduction histidine kinase/CheY-like chemotaxis protein